MRKLILAAALCCLGTAASAADLDYEYGSRPPPPAYGGPAGPGYGPPEPRPTYDRPPPRQGYGYGRRPPPPDDAGPRPAYGPPVPGPGYDRPVPRPGYGGPAAPTYGEADPDDDDDDGWDEAARRPPPRVEPECWTRPSPWGPERICRR